MKEFDYRGDLADLYDRAKEVPFEVAGRLPTVSIDELPERHGMHRFVDALHWHEPITVVVFHEDGWDGPVVARRLV